VLGGVGCTATVANTESITAHSGGGTDSAKLYGNPTAVDTFEGRPCSSTLSGNGFSNRVESFRYVHAFGTEGNGDVALLYDRAGTKDRFEATPVYARLYGDNFYNRAVQFDQAYGYGTPGDADITLLYDDPGGKDTLQARPDRAKLAGAGFDNEAVSFRYVHAFGTPVSQDEAHLYDSALDQYPDYLEADANWARLSNDLLGYAYWVREFEEVTANSSNPSDIKNVDPDALDFILNGEEGW